MARPVGRLTRQRCFERCYERAIRKGLRAVPSGELLAVKERLRRIYDVTDKARNTFAHYLDGEYLLTPSQIDRIGNEFAKYGINDFWGL